MVNAKHLATFVLGAAAGVALHKYFQTEEGEKMLGQGKEKTTECQTSFGHSYQDVQKISELSQEIQSATREQEIGISEISKAILR